MIRALNKTRESPGKSEARAAAAYAAAAAAVVGRGSRELAVWAQAREGAAGEEGGEREGARGKRGTHWRRGAGVGLALKRECRGWRVNGKVEKRGAGELVASRQGLRQGHHSRRSGQTSVGLGMGGIACVAIACVLHGGVLAGQRCRRKARQAGFALLRLINCD